MIVLDENALKVMLHSIAELNRMQAGFHLGVSSTDIWCLLNGREPTGIEANSSTLFADLLAAYVLGFKDRVPEAVIRVVDFWPDLVDPDIN